jgi:hypothetical protein
MKIALCLYGQTRGRDYGKALPSWEKFMHKYQPDLYWHTWDSVPVYGLFQYNLKAGLIESSDLDLSWFSRGVTEYGSSARNVCHQVESINKSLGLRTLDYEWTVRSRFDLVLHNPDVLDFNLMDQRKHYICSNHWRDSNTTFDDNIMIGGRFSHVMQKNSLRAHLIQYIKSKRLIPSGEQLLYDFFETYKSMDTLVKTEALDFTLARNI